MKPWLPILEGAAAEAARRAVQDIAAALVSVEPGPPARAAELALFHAYYATAFDDRVAEARASELLEQAITGLAETPLPEALHGGFSGVAWVVRHLDPDGPDVDEAIERLVDRDPWSGAIDLVSGLVGLGIYLLEGRPGLRQRASLERIVAHLEARSEPVATGLTWPTGAEALPEWARPASARACYDLGMAHGVPGVIGLLGRICRAGIGGAQARRLLDGGVAWLLSIPPAGADARYAAFLVAEEPALPASPSAWCYGDPGVAIALLGAARAVGQVEWESAALALARGVVARPPEQAGGVDAGLCHGWVGRAHILNRFHQATGDPSFSRAARLWIDRALSDRRPGDGLAGFAAHETDLETGRKVWRAQPGLLTGIAGIGLGLLAALHPLEPEWDRCLLCDVGS